MNISGILISIFFALLKLYPKPFRREFEEEMQMVFAARVSDQAEAGPFQLVISCLFEFLDLFHNLFIEYWAAFQKECNMDNFLYGKFHNHLILWGGLVFGLAYGLQMLFGSLTGLHATSITHYTIPTLLASFLTEMLFIGAATGIFWLGTPRYSKKWRFLLPVVGVGVISLLNLIILITVVLNPQVGSFPEGWFWRINYPELYTLIWSLAFGGFFGWAYRGWKAIIPFALVTVLSKFLRYIIGWIMVVALKINLSPSENIWQNPQSFFWPLVWVITGGIIFGALLGWAANKVNHKGGSDWVAI